MHYATLVHFVEGQDPLPIANTPYFPESEYLTREARIFKLLRQTILKQQEDAKAREDHLLQKQLELEADNSETPIFFYLICFCITLYFSKFIYIYIKFFLFRVIHVYLCFSFLSIFLLFLLMTKGGVVESI